MGIIDTEDVIAWKDGSLIICANCGYPEGDLRESDEVPIPLTQDDFRDTDIVTCDRCEARIY